MARVCGHCDYVAKNWGGLERHINRCGVLLGTKRRKLARVEDAERGPLSFETQSDYIMDDTEVPWANGALPEQPLDTEPLTDRRDDLHDVVNIESDRGERYGIESNIFYNY